MQNYRTCTRRRRNLAEMLEFQHAQKRREVKWKEHLGHLRQVEHALLDINRVLPSADGAASDGQETTPVGFCSYSCLRYYVAFPQEAAFHRSS